MATNRSWKFQDFVAHESNVNCLALGHKSGRVMVTGGDDKKVNLWAIGRPTCFMSLTGHTAPIECVQFNQLEELVCAGSRAGALKVWDLEAARLVRTLAGHRGAVRALDFGPYGDMLVSAGADAALRVWDTRKKSCICALAGHRGAVNGARFSPDCLWVASGGDDGTVRVWDLRVGRVLKEFAEHAGAVRCVEFHPHEFLLAAGGADRSVHFFDLESFASVSSERELGAARCLCFNPDGECLFVGVREHLKVVGWEPSKIYDSVPMSRVNDISVAQSQLIGASFHLSNVQVFVVDLKKVYPICPNSNSDSLPSSPFTPNTSIRKSFSKSELPISLKNRSLDVKTIEESTSGTDPEEDSTGAEVTNVKDYNEIFKGRGLTRTPPLEPEPFQQPEHDYNDPSEPQILVELTTDDNFEALSLDNNINYSPPPPVSPYSRSKSNLDTVYVSRLTRQQDRENILPNINKTKPTVASTPIATTVDSTTSLNRQSFVLQRQSSCRDVPETPKSNLIKHAASEVNLSKSGAPPSTRNVSARRNSFSRTVKATSVQNINTKIPNLAPNSTRKGLKGQFIDSRSVELYVSSKISPEQSPTEEDEEFVPLVIDRPVGLDLDDFIPKNQQTGFQQHLLDMSEAEMFGSLMRGHQSMMAMIGTRERSLKVVVAEYRNKDIKAAIESAVAMDDLAVLIDLLTVFNQKSSLWSLDLCVLILPKVENLLHSKFETYMTTGCNTLRLILRHFGSVIKNNISAPVGSFGVDITREERYRKSIKCHESLTSLKTFLIKKQSMPGTIGSIFKEVSTLMQNTFE